MLCQILISAYVSLHVKPFVKMAIAIKNIVVKLNNGIKLSGENYKFGT